MAFEVDQAKELAEKIEAIVNNPHIISGLQDDDAVRRRLREAARKLSLSMEAPQDTIHKLTKTPLQLALARIGVETRLFEVLTEGNGRAFTNRELAHKTSVDPVLMKRLLRYYQSYDMISQPGDDDYRSNNITDALASDGGQAAINHFFESVSPAYMALPRFLRETGYVNPTDPSYLPWNIGHQSNVPIFHWFQSHPDNSKWFLSWMTAQRAGLPIFLDAIDFEQELGQGTTESTALFVDVGGAKGHQCIALRDRFPNLRGRVILQEQAHVIAQVRENPLPGFDNIETEVYDFFTPQPIKGARAYYLRNILHDWPGDKCKQILQSIKAGMTEDSVLLVDEMLLPERGAPWRATQIDMTMCVCLGAAERSEKEWRALLDDAGFRISKIWKYTEECEDCVMVAVPKEFA
ncbi:putative sterigmatocystin 8-O-methyltransferase precursor [Xylariaceae sp. FL0662B]|nr:putative sterigmatocystin 8-O-methyltransferase precursor [Xylariaceae sp. FL0662B]